MDRAVCPSTPTVRAPLLFRTRSRAPQKERRAGSEVEQSIEPAIRIIAGPAVQLGADQEHRPGPGRGARDRDGHRSPPDRAFRKIK